MKSIHAIAKVTLLAIVCSTLVALSAPAVSAQGGKVIDAILTASPEAYDGPCPATINFRGKITTDGPATVQFQFENSGSPLTTPIETLVFDRAGTKAVTTRWILGDARLPSYSGWEVLVVRAPNELRSNRAGFKFRCKAQQGGGPLTHAQPGTGSPNSPGRIITTKKIVFVSERDHNYEIYIMNADGSEQTNLTRHPADDLNPQLSPDATRVVFQSRRDGNEEIYSMNVDGSDVRRLTNDASADLDPAWSPDGRRIVFARGMGAEFELYVMNADGGSPSRLTSDGAYASAPAWSPDGRKIAYASRRGGNTDIYVMNVTARTTERLTFDLAQDVQPHWSPDSTRIMFVRQTGSDDDIWVMNADGSRQTNTTSDPAALDGDPVWSRDGRKIAFVKNPIGGPLNIWTMNPDGSGQMQITTSGVDVHPDW